MDLQHATFLITGANRGLGLALSRAALAAGAKVYAAARDPAQITLPGVVPLRLDVTDPQQVAAAARGCDDVNVLVNNAGLMQPGPVLDLASAEHARAQLDTNLLGPWRMASAFAPVLARHSQSALVNVLSVLSWLSLPDAAAYCASKAAAWSLTNSLRSALTPQGTTVMGVHLGYMDTDMTAGVDAPKLSPDTVAEGLLQALARGDTEYLADDLSRNVKRGLAGPAA